MYLDIFYYLLMTKHIQIPRLDKAMFLVLHIFKILLDFKFKKKIYNLKFYPKYEHILKELVTNDLYIGTFVILTWLTQACWI